MCSAQIRDGLLTCVRDHEGSGHVFIASAGYDLSNAEAEEDW